MEEQVVQAGNQIYMYISMGVVVAFVALDKAMAFISKKRNSNGKGNGNSTSYYREIMENKTRSLINKQAIDAMCKTINGMKEENKEDHKTIFSKLDRLFEKVK